MQKVKSYTKKPIVVQAIQYMTENISDVILFLGDFPHQILYHERLIVIHTLEGDHLVRHGDYIVKGAYEEYYPVKPTIFEETYQLVTNNQ